MTRQRAVPGHGRVAAGRRARPPAVRHTSPTASSWRPAARSPTATVAYETWGDAGARRGRTRCSCCTRSPATATPPDPPGRATATSDGGTAPSVPGARSTPTASSSSAPTCSAGARARPDRRRTHRTAGPTGRASRCTTIRDQVALEVALADAARHRPVARGGRRLDGRHAGARVGRRPAATACERAVIISVGAQATAEEIALCHVQMRAIRADPKWRGGDYYDAAPGDGPHDGLADRPRHRAHQLPHRARAGGTVRARPPGGRGAVRRRPVRGRVLSRLPGRQAGAALRRQHLSRAVGGDEPPRRRARPGRHRRRARHRHRRRHHRRHVVGPALSGAAPAGAGRADPDRRRPSRSCRPSPATTASSSRPSRSAASSAAPSRHVRTSGSCLPQRARTDGCSIRGGSGESRRGGRRSRPRRAPGGGRRRGRRRSRCRPRGASSAGSTASGESAADAWVMRAGCSMSDSTPPSDSASVNRRVRGRPARAPSPRHRRPGTTPCRRSRASGGARSS